MECRTGALYIITPLGQKSPKDHCFSCGKHLGELVRGAIEGTPKCKVKVAYVPAPGDQPCEFWGRRS